jgi:carbamoyltransferase
MPTRWPRVYRDFLKHMSNILGISAFYHDSAAALVQDGQIVGAAQEERFTRKKHDQSFPNNSVDYCLREADLQPEDLDYVVFYDKPLLKFERLLETYLAFAPQGLPSFLMAMPLWLKTKLHLPKEIRKSIDGRFNKRIVFTGHHESHAASAFFPSPYDEAAILTMDGVGEWDTASIGIGRGHKIELLKTLQFPHSLGLLYSAFTYFTGFKVNSGEYKLMGLAPYGEPKYVDLILDKIVDVKEDGSLAMDMRYFNYCQGLTMTNGEFDKLFGGPPRNPESMITQREMDLAASVQKVVEKVVLRMAKTAKQLTGARYLCMAGGVALNCVANGKLLRAGIFDDIFITPASGDAGGALGAALFLHYQLLEKPRLPNGKDSLKGSLLGPRYTNEEIRKFFDERKAPYTYIENEDQLLKAVAEKMAAGKVVGWFHGRMEFGPRALGARSIIGDARDEQMQSQMNLRIKFRESFRPFAPCVLREDVDKYFELDRESPYMLLVADVRPELRNALTPEQNQLMKDPDLLRRVNVKRSTIPAVTHVDMSARIQTVDEQRHGRFWRLMKEFKRTTGCGVIVNTSFNLSWEPIVRTPKEAYHTFMQSEMDMLVMEDFILQKNQQPLGLHAWASPDEKKIVDPDSPWADALTGDPLVMTQSGALNPVTGINYAVEEGIPRLFVPTERLREGQDVTEVVKQFYEETPFPNYEDMDNVRGLLEKAHQGLFARLLNEQIPYDARVVEIGCGTGQLTNFLAIAHRSVLGTDMCLNSLRLAQRFKIEQGLEQATFAQMNLFRPALRNDFFDYVICNGVLHHTSDPRGAFQRLAKLVKPGGYIVIGLYSAYSRQLHYLRRALFRLTGFTSRWLDPHFGRMGAAGKRQAWFQDQYCHPHESCHTLDETLTWLDEEGFDFVNSIPKPVVGPILTPEEQLFAPHPKGSRSSRVLSQLSNVASGYREGGFFLFIGRRR